MQLSYTYRVIESTVTGLLVVFKTTDMPDTQVSMPQPPAALDRDAFIRAFAPVGRWVDELTLRQTVEKGHEGSGTATFLLPGEQPPAQPTAPTMTLESRTL